MLPAVSVREVPDVEGGGMSTKAPRWSIDSAKLLPTKGRVIVWNADDKRWRMTSARAVVANPARYPKWNYLSCVDPELDFEMALVEKRLKREGVI